MCKKKISEFVKEKRRSSGLSLTQFAELYNVSRAQIAKYEAGTLDDPTLLVVSKFCKNFDITGQEFIEQFQFNDSISTDPDSLIYSINHLINTVFQPDVKAYIADFFKYNYERYCLHGLNNATGPEQHMLHTDAYSSCFNRYDEHVSINAIKYKKRQIGKIRKSGSKPCAYSTPMKSELPRQELPGNFVFHGIRM